MTSVNDKITFKSVPENLVIAEDYIENVCNTCKVGPDVFGNILVTVTEAVNNAIYHGNKSDESKDVVLSHDFDKELRKLIFIIEDEGEGFDYNNLADPTSPENITVLGGRGVFLIKQLADWVIFNDKGNIIQLQFKI